MVQKNRSLETARRSIEMKETDCKVPAESDQRHQRAQSEVLRDRLRVDCDQSLRYCMSRLTPDILLRCAESGGRLRMMRDRR
jgi:hypothetical protein